MKLVSFLRFRCALLPRAAFLALAVTAVLAPSVRADDPPPTRLHGLFNLEVSDKYLTPRGMIVQDEGVTIQPLFLAFLDVYDGAPDAFITDVSLTAGFWSDFATDTMPEHLGPGSTTTNFVEIDPILGVSFGIGKNFKLDVTYTAFVMQILDIGTSEHLEVKLGYNDTDLLGAFALHPYLLFWKELDNKATAAANFGHPSSYYFEVGVTPGTKVGSVKLEAPLRALLPASDFYGETFGDSSTVALYEVGLKATFPLDFMPKGYGFWSAHVGFRYMSFEDDNLKQLATDGGFGSPTDDTAQLYSGLTVFF